MPKIVITFNTQGFPQVSFRDGLFTEIDSEDIEKTIEILKSYQKLKPATRKLNPDNRQIDYDV